MMWCATDETITGEQMQDLVKLNLDNVQQYQMYRHHMMRVHGVDALTRRMTVRTFKML